MALRHPASFADLLKTWRRAAGLTQEELAERARMSARAISDLERGAKRHPYRDTVRRIVEALALTEEQRALLEAAARGRQQRPVPSPGPQPREPGLVGRTAEMERLRRHLGGEGAPVLFVQGEPGIGKSRLLHEIGVVAEARGLEVLWGGCTRRSRHEPFAPLADALGRYLSAQRPGRQRELLKGASWLIRLLPELLDEVEVPLPLSKATEEGERRLLFAAVNRFLARVGPLGVVLLLDDLQWAGPDALDLLGFIVEGAVETGVRVVAAYRSTEVQTSDDLVTLRSDLGARYLAEEMGIPPLSTRESAALLDALVGVEISPALQSHILQQSGGVPFYLSSYAYSIAAIGDTAPVPWTAAQSVRQRVAAVRVQAQGLLAAAALVGRASPTWLLSRVVDLDEKALVEALEGACHAGLLQELDAHHYTFVHDVIRDVVEGDLSAARREMLHRRIADALEALPLPERHRHAAQLAWHLEHAGEPNRAADYALVAGDAASRALAHSEAAEHYQSAAAMSEGRDAAKRAEALYRLGGARLLQGRLSDAAAALEEAANLRCRIRDTEGEALAVSQLGWMQFYSGDAESILPRVRRLIDVLHSHGPSRGLCSLYLLLTLLLFGPDPGAGLDAAERASAMARELEDDELRVQAEVRRGLALGGVGRWAEGAQVLEAIMPLAEQIGDLTRLAEGFAFAGIAHTDLGNLERALDLQARSLHWAQQLGSPGHQAYTLGARAFTLFLVGRWEEAREHLERAVELDRTSGTPAFSYTYALSLARLAQAEGRREEAARHLEEARCLAPADAQELVAVYGACLLAEQELLSGRCDAAQARLAPYLGGLTARPNAHLSGIPVAAEVLLEAGDVEGAERLLDIAESVARPQGYKVVVADILRVRGILLARSGGTGVDALFAQALSCAAALPCPRLEGRILREWGRVTAHEQAGKERLQRAREIFQRLGAAPDAKRTRAVLHGS